MPTSDVTPYGLATASALLQENVRIGGDINIIRLKSKINPVYISHLLNFSKKEIIRLVTGTTVKHIYAKDIESLSLMIPKSYEEQSKISDLLSLFDERVGVIDKRVVHIETFKKGLLQKMFA